MEFRLNKIEPDLRQKINEETKEGKVHSKKGIAINKDKSEERQRRNKEQQKPKEKFNLSKYVKEGKKITINAIKTSEISIKAEKQDEEKLQNLYKGVFIDAVK